MPAPQRVYPGGGLAGAPRSSALFSHRDDRRCYLMMNVAGAAVVAFTLIARLSRG
ncbi:hypothetical protein ABIB51_001184 [Arthrobacter sp. UYCu712]